MKYSSAHSILVGKKPPSGREKNPNVLFIEYDDFLVFVLNILSLFSVIALIRYCLVYKR